MAFPFFLSLTRDRLSLCLFFAFFSSLPLFSFPHSLSPSAFTLTLPLSSLSPLASSVRLHSPSPDLLGSVSVSYLLPLSSYFFCPLFLFFFLSSLVFPLSLSLCLFCLCLMRETSLSLSLSLLSLPLSLNSGQSAHHSTRGEPRGRLKHTRPVCGIYGAHSCCSSTSTFLQTVESMARSIVCESEKAREKKGKEGNRENVREGGERVRGRQEKKETGKKRGNAPTNP